MPEPKVALTKEFVYYKVASRNMCYYSGNLNFCIWKSRLLTCHIIFLLYLTLIDILKGAYKMINFDFSNFIVCVKIYLKSFLRITWRKEEYGGNGYKNCLWNGEKYYFLGFEHSSWTLLEGERPGLRSCFMLKAEIFSAFEELS